MEHSKIHVMIKRLYEHSLRSCLAIFLFIFLSSSPSFAIGECGSYLQAQKTLTEKYKEQRIGIGLSPDLPLPTGKAKAAVELWASSEGTFTVLIVFPNSDKSCLVASGTDLDLKVPNLKDLKIGTPL